MDNVNNGGRGTQPPAGGSSGAPRKKKKKKFSILRLIGKFFFFLFTLCVIGVLTATIFFKIFMTYVSTTLVPTLDVAVEELTMSEASTIYYQDNATGQWITLDTLFAQEGNRKIVEYNDLPQHLIDALVAIEDKRFWTHSGVDWEGTAAAFVKTFTSGSTRGGSTITQQVLRNITKDNDVTVKRKVREIFRALEFEKNNSKEDILTLYLNYVYFGSGCDGIQTAAEKYFGKDVSDLTIAESAALIGITNNPSLYNPFRYAEFKQDDGSIKTPRDFNKRRQEIILGEMLAQEYITQAEYDAAVKEELLFTDTPEYAALHANDPAKTPVSNTDPYTWFTDVVIDEAITLIAEAKNCDTTVAEDLLFSAGYHIYTTLDMDIQNIVDSVYEDPSNFDYPSSKGTPLDSAITITDPYTGDIVAMAGGVGEKEGSRTLNLATSRRPCGSAIKPLSVYAPAIENNVTTPAGIFDDYPYKLNEDSTGGYPKNSNNKYRGSTTISYAVQWSLNTVAARTLQQLGIGTSFDFMEQNLGFDLDSRDLDIGPLSMGGLTYGVTTVEMASAFGAFANNGIYTKPRTIIRIEDNNHNTIVENTSQSNVAMKETTAYLMNNMLRSVITGGTGTSASFKGMTIAGKTGTTSNNFDRYFVGYTPYYSAAVWVGYSQSNEKISGTKNPAALAWKLVMEQVHAGLENKSFPEKPDGLTTVQVCSDCGLLPSALCELDYRGSRVISVEIQKEAEPKETCTCHIEVKVCTNPETGEVHLAGEYCPETTCSTRVMLQGRQFMEIPHETPITYEDGTVETGTPIVSEDAEAHLTYLQMLGACPLHDQFYVPGELMPGDPGYEWPNWWPDNFGGVESDPYYPYYPSTPSEPDNNTVPGGDSWLGNGSTINPWEPQEPSTPSDPYYPSMP